MPIFHLTSSIDMMVEMVFEQNKLGLGFLWLLLRGLERVNQEWLMMYTGHNPLNLFRFGNAVSE